MPCRCADLIAGLHGHGRHSIGVRPTPAVEAAAQRATRDTPMRIDVVLATYNRAHLLGPAIASFAANRWPEARLLVVDNNSSDGTQAAVEAEQAAYPTTAIEYLHEPQQGKAHALNRGVALSDADVVGFFDDDEVLAPDWLGLLAQAFADPTLDFAGGPVRPDWRAPQPGWLPAAGYNGVLSLVDAGQVQRRYGEPGFSAMLIGANAAIRRATLRRVGPYTTRYKWAEDREMYARLLAAGAVGHYLPELAVYHHIPPKRLTKRYYRQWAYSEGRTNGSPLRAIEEGRAPPRAVLGAPLWMWRQTLGAAGRLALGCARGRLNDPQTFCAELDLRQFAGFFIEQNLPFIKHRHFDRT